MDDQVSYTRVGAFVLLLGAVLVAGVLWLSAGLGTRRAVDTYQAFLQESVSGLSVDAPVKYLGVDVGKVSRIEIDPGNSRQVHLLFLIDRGTPIKRDSLAVLKSQGLTGIAYIELSGGSLGSPPLAASPNGVPPTIPVKLSLSARLENVLTHVAANLDRMSDSLSGVFDADNRAALKATLADTAALMHALAAQKAALAAGVADAARTAHQMAHLTAQADQQLPPTLARIATAAEAVERMAGVAGAAAARAGSVADAAASGVQQMSGETLPELSGLMAELSELAVSLRRLSDQTVDSPSSLLVGRPAPVPGPGEKAIP